MAPLTRLARRRLLQIARAAIAAALRGRPARPREPADPALSAPAGAFVTLRLDGQLRGCIGSLEAGAPLYRTVCRMAASAAFDDPRFPSLQEEEFGRLALEISVLSPLERIRGGAEVVVGRHGLYVVQGPYRGVLLPQVATEQGWDRVRFLEETCRKAGLARDAWRTGAELYTFEAQVFGEEEG